MSINKSSGSVKGSHNSSSYGARSVFPQAPSFTLETFSDRDFLVKDFVEALSDNAVPAARKSASSSTSNAFDPKPLIRSFEHALRRMSDLSGDLELRENELSGAVRRAEAQHTSSIQTLGHRLDETVEAFNRLDSTLNGDDYDKGGNAIVKIGDRLEDLDKQRKRALDARFLIQCWIEVSERGELYLLEDIRKSGKGEGKVRCAQIARQLSRISQRLDPENWTQNKGVDGIANGVKGSDKSRNRKKRRHNTRELIEKFSETLEKDLLKSFDEYYRRQNFDGMRECAKVLHDFNDGASVIGAFVNQHQFFIERSQLITEEVGGDLNTWERLADPDADPPGVEPSLQSLLDEVRIVVQEESIIIKRAFPYSDQVMGRFLQRIFQQSIQQRLEMVLEKAGSVSSLAFLRSLQAARGYISGLIDELKTHGLTEHPDVVSPQISILLDQQLEDLFVPYFVGSSYIEREKRSLEELYASLLFKFTIYHSRRRKIPTTFMKSLAKTSIDLLASARDAYVERLDSSDLAAPQKRMLLRVAGLKDSDGSAKTQTDIEVTDADGILRIDNAKRMLKWLAEAIGRGLELSSGNETAKDVYALTNLLMVNLGEIYIETALDAAMETATAQETSKLEPDLSYLISLRSAISTMYLLSTYTRTVLVPLGTANITIRREMEKTAMTAVNRMEEKVNGIMQRSIDVAITWIIKLLAQQKKTDFRPREDIPSGPGDVAWLEQLQTPTCQAIFSFLTRLHQLALTALSPSPNLIAFLTEVAVCVRSSLLEHFKKFPVSATGGIMVTKDISKYVELLKSWDLDESFAPSFDVLHEIGNLFVIGPEALKERLRGVKTGAASGTAGTRVVAAGGGTAWDAADLRPYVLRREDVGSVGVQAALSAL